MQVSGFSALASLFRPRISTRRNAVVLTATRPVKDAEARLHARWRIGGSEYGIELLLEIPISKHWQLIQKKSDVSFYYSPMCSK